MTFLLFTDEARNRLQQICRDLPDGTARRIIANRAFTNASRRNADRIELEDVVNALEENWVRGPKVSDL